MSSRECILKCRVAGVIFRCRVAGLSVGVI